MDNRKIERVSIEGVLGLKCSWRDKLHNNFIDLAERNVQNWQKYLFTKFQLDWIDIDADDQENVQASMLVDLLYHTKLVDFMINPICSQKRKY